MVHHIIIFELKEELTAEEKNAQQALIKEGLEALVGVVPGLVSLHVQTDFFDGSNGDVLLRSTFIDKKSLEGYSIHPAHVKVANERVRPFVSGRHCVDFDDSTSV